MRATRIKEYRTFCLASLHADLCNEKSMKYLCKFGVGKTRPKICSESGFGEVLGFVWDGFGTLWAVFWALLGALGVIFGHSKSFLFRALAQDGLQEASGINLGSILEGFGEGFGRFGRSLGSFLA